MPDILNVAAAVSPTTPVAAAGNAHRGPESQSGRDFASVLEAAPGNPEGTGEAVGPPADSGNAALPVTVPVADPGNALPPWLPILPPGLAVASQAEGSSVTADLPQAAGAAPGEVLAQAASAIAQQIQKKAAPTTAAPTVSVQAEIDAEASAPEPGSALRLLLPRAAEPAEAAGGDPFPATEAHRTMNLASIAETRADAANSAPVRADAASAVNPGAAPRAESTGSAPAPAAVTVNLPVNHPKWSDAVASRVLWQVSEGVQHAHMHLNPPELGPVEVRVTVSDNQVNTQFLTHHGAARQALEDAMPRLRDMLAQSGLNLMDANVFQHAPGGDQNPEAAAFYDPASGRFGTEDVDLPVHDLLPRRLHTGLIDAYA